MIGFCLLPWCRSTVSVSLLGIDGWLVFTHVNVYAAWSDYQVSETKEVKRKAGGILSNTSCPVHGMYGRICRRCLNVSPAEISMILAI